MSLTTAIQYPLPDVGLCTSSAASSREFELLLASCLADTQDISMNHVRLVLEGPLDWAQVMRLAERHDLDAELYPVLSHFSEAVPGFVIEQLRLRHARNAQKNLRLTQELIRLLDCLDSHGISAISYKGPALAHAAFGDVALRQFSDLDILIRPTDLARAKAAVRELGYSPVARLTGFQERAYIASGYECSFDGPAGRNLLEMQWRILPRFYAIDLDIDSLFRRSTTLILGGKSIRSLASDDLLIVLCLHAAKHAWARLSYLRDLAAVVRTQTINYGRVRVEACELGIERIVGMSFWLVNSLAGVSVPPAINEWLVREAEIATLGTRIREILQSNSEFDPEQVGYFRLMMRLRERRKHKLQLLFRLLFTPGSGEWATVRLPEPFFPLYSLIRLGRLTTRVLKGRVKA